MLELDVYSCGLAMLCANQGFGSVEATSAFEGLVVDLVVLEFGVVDVKWFFLLMLTSFENSFLMFSSP